ncbi:hypothetical protein A0O00_09845 [Proteus mirabilis]|nr:hypothetical protein A0O00_09845 [Proteus mirabilis]
MIEKKTIEKIMLSLLLEEISQGKALKILRLNILGLKQDAYAKLVNISRKTLSDIENDKGNYSIDIINKAFKPFGLKIGLVPATSHMLLSILKKSLPMSDISYKTVFFLAVMTLISLINIKHPQNGCFLLMDTYLYFMFFIL